MATTSARPESSTTSSWRQSGEEARGASQIGPFDYCPRVGFREYWYPGVWAAKVGRKRPVKVRMLGEDIVLFRGTKGDVVALTDWCPHRGARLSLGECDFAGTVTCPYHGYVFDETGQCVAGLIESVNSPLAPKLRAKNYPTAERNGIVFIWMGMTTPVPLEDDLPWEFLDDSLNTTRHARVRSWETNWTEPTWQGIDYHEFYLHRRTKFWHLIDHKLPFLRPKPVVTNGIKIIDEGENYVACIQRDVEYGQNEYPGLGKWPRHTWWRRLPRVPRKDMGFGVEHTVQLPSIVRVPVGALHLRWSVPVDEWDTRVWSFTISKRPRTPLGQAFEDLWYYTYRLPNQLIAVNEKEDFPVFAKGAINMDIPQKLGTLDVAVIHFRRHLAKKSRDFQRLGGAYGCVKQPPDPVRVAEWTAAGAP